MVEGSELGLLDVITFSVIGLASLFGMWRGFISSVLSLFGWFFSIYLTFKLYPVVSSIFISSGKETMATMAFGYLIVLVITLVTLSIANSLIMAATGSLRAGGIDSILGLAFGCIKGLVVVFCLYYALVVGGNVMAGNKVLLDDKAEGLPTWLVTSKTHTLIDQGGKAVLASTPIGLRSSLHDAYMGMTNRGVEDKFIGHVLDEITSALPLQARTELALYKEGNSMRESASKLQLELATKALDAYDRSVSTGLIQRNSVDQTDITKLRNILAMRYSEAQGRGSGTPAASPSGAGG